MFELISFYVPTLCETYWFKYVFHKLLLLSGPVYPEFPPTLQKKKSDCAGSSALIALVEFDVDDYSYEKLTLDLRGETLLSCVAVVWPSSPEQIPNWNVM